MRSLIAVFVLGSLALADSPDGGRVADPRAGERLQMVERYLVQEGIRDPATLQAIRSVPRHEFVPPELVSVAYDNRPLPIGSGRPSPSRTSWPTRPRWSVPARG